MPLEVAYYMVNKITEKHLQFCIRKVMLIEWKTPSSGSQFLPRVEITVSAAAPF